MGGWLLTSRTLDGRLAIHKPDINWQADCSQAGHNSGAVYTKTGHRVGRRLLTCRTHCGRPAGCKPDTANGGVLVHRTFRTLHQISLLNSSKIISQIKTHVCPSACIVWGTAGGFRLNLILKIKSQSQGYSACF